MQEKMFSANLTRQTINDMVDFFPQERISNPSKLFGRESDLRELINATETKTQLQIIGARRFGKTTISLCLETILRYDKDCRVYPLYTDVKKAQIKGSADFYRYLTAMLINRLSYDKVFRSKQKFGMISIRPSSDYLKVFSELKNVPDSYMDHLFIRITKTFAEKLNKTILVIFDEFEYLAKSTFYDNLEGFYPLRDFSTDRLDSGLRPFFFWLVGARPWGAFVRENRLSKVDVIGGSGEFNGVEIEHYLSPIDKDAFLLFWQSRCNEYYETRKDENEEKEYLISLGEKVYDSVSGVPFYGSAVAKHIKAFGSFPDYTSIKSHLDEALGIFDSNTLSYMRSLCSPKLTIQNDTFKQLQRYGFARVSEDGTCCLSMGFLRDYLTNKIPIYEQQPGKTEDAVDIEVVVNGLVDDINELIKQINGLYRTKRDKAVFDSPDQAVDDDKCLRKICRSQNDFKDFLSVVYLMFYERSKAKRPDIDKMVPGQLLFEVEQAASGLSWGLLKDSREYYRNREFFMIIEPLRASYYGHIPEKVERQDNQYTSDEALEHLKGNSDPPENHEWPQLQVSILELFKNELGIIKREIKSIS